MKFLEKRLCVKLCSTNPFAFYHFESKNLKPPKANQTLQRYIKSNCPTKALSLFRQILRKSLSTIDSHSLLFALKACAQKSSLIEGQTFHGLVFKLGFEHVIQLETCLIKMYSATCNLVLARKVFDEMSDRSVVSWTALISAHVENRRPGEALGLFRRMQIENVEPDRVAITAALSACADLGALGTGEWIRAYAQRKTGFNPDLHYENALLNMYAKCGDLRAARRLFDGMRARDVATWTTMIAGHALHGEAGPALKLFSEMRPAAEPNEVTFLAVLVACSHAGMVAEAARQFRSMSEDFRLAPGEPHYGAMVDSLCRAGLVAEAARFVARMPARARTAVAWRTLLGAAGGDVGLGEAAGRRLAEIEPGRAGDRVALANVYAASGMWERKAAAREGPGAGRRRVPGCSSVEVGGEGVREFVAGSDDLDCRFKDEICEVLKCLLASMKDCDHSCNISWLDGWY